MIAQDPTSTTEAQPRQRRFDLGTLTVAALQTLAQASVMSGLAFPLADAYRDEAAAR